MQEARPHEQAKVPQSRLGVRIGGDVEQADEQEDWDVLKVIQVVSEGEILWGNFSNICRR